MGYDLRTIPGYDGPNRPADHTPVGLLQWCEDRCVNVIGGFGLDPDSETGFSDLITLHPIRGVDVLGVEGYENAEACAYHRGGVTVDGDGWSVPVVAVTPDRFAFGEQDRQFVSLGGVFAQDGENADGLCAEGDSCTINAIPTPATREFMLLSKAVECGLDEV